MRKICVLIPSYNEAKTIGAIVKRLKDESFAVYVVDDGSTDATSQEARREGATVIRTEMNRGKGMALREGFDRVLKEGYEAVAVMDGDDQHDINDMNNLIEAMESRGADMVIGNRMKNTSSMPLIRVVVNRIMSGMISKISGQHVPDSQCGFRLIKREVLENIRLESAKYEIDSEIILRAAEHGFKIESVPIRTVYQNEKSRIDPVLDTIRFFAFLARFKRERRGLTG